MNAIDFQYDDLYLSDFGYMICTFDSGNSPETIPGSPMFVYRTCIVNIPQAVYW